MPRQPNTENLEEMLRHDRKEANRVKRRARARWLIPLCIVVGLAVFGVVKLLNMIPKRRRCRR